MEGPDPEGRHRTQRQATRRPAACPGPARPPAWEGASLAGVQAAGGELSPQGPGQALPAAAGRAAAASTRSKGSRGRCGATLTAILPTAQRLGQRRAPPAAATLPVQTQLCARASGAAPEPHERSLPGWAGQEAGSEGGGGAGASEGLLEAVPWVDRTLRPRLGVAPCPPLSCRVPSGCRLSWPLPSRVSSGHIRAMEPAGRGPRARRRAPSWGGVWLLLPGPLGHPLLGPASYRDLALTAVAAVGAGGDRLTVLSEGLEHDSRRQAHAQT